MKKLLFLMFALLICISFVSANEIVLEEDFDSYSTGDLDLVSDWGKYIVNPNYPDHVGYANIVSTDSVSSPNSLNVGIPPNIRYVYPSGHVHFNKNITSGSLESYIKKSTNSKMYGTILLSENGKIKIKVIMDRDGSFSYSGFEQGYPWTSLNIPYSANTWYKIKINWYEDNTFDLYINNDLVARNLDFNYNMVNGINQLTFLAGNSGGGDVDIYVDDIKVVKYITTSELQEQIIVLGDKITGLETQLNDSSKDTELEKRVSDLESWKDTTENQNLNSRLTSLEAWKVTISQAFDSLKLKLEAISNWLKFWEETDDICDVLNDNCNNFLKSKGNKK